jgi:DNA-binding MarR family transcriptional regulator
MSTAKPPLFGALLRLAWQQVRSQMADDVRAAGFSELQDAHLSVFQYPGPDGLRPSDLARQMRMTRQATNYLIVQLEGFGYLQRRASAAEDRRCVYLTPRGHDLLAAIVASVRRFERRLARRVGQDRFDTFVHVLRIASTSAPVQTTPTRSRSGSRHAGVARRSRRTRS